MGGPRSPLRRDLRTIFSEGVAWSVMVGLGETYFPAFALALGMGELSAALLSSVPLVAGATLQLLTPLGVRLCRSRRRWAVLSASTQAASFLPLIAGAAYGRLSGVVVFLCAILYWAAGLSTGPVWNVWVGNLVPRRLRARFFSRRTGATQIGTLTGLLCGGAVLQFLHAQGRPLAGFGILFTVAAACRVLSSRLLGRQSEPPDLPVQDRILGARALFRRLRGAPNARVLVFFSVFTAGVSIASPFFTPYLLTELSFSYSQYMILIAASYAAKIITLPAWGRLAQRQGAVPVLRLGSAGVMLIPALWIVSLDYTYLLALQVVAGVVWAAVDLATVLLLFDAIEDEERTSLLVYFNFANALATVGGAAVGGFIFRELGEGLHAYRTLYLASLAGRVGSLLLLLRVYGVGPPRIRLFLRTIALRPAPGSLDVPLLAPVLRGGRRLLGGRTGRNTLPDTDSPPTMEDS